MSEERGIVLGPLFTIGLVLALYGLVRRRSSILAAGTIAIAADRSPPGRRLAKMLHAVV
jgi:hypothetical protein